MASLHSDDHTGNGQQQSTEDSAESGMPITRTGHSTLPPGISNSLQRQALETPQRNLRSTAEHQEVPGDQEEQQHQYETPPASRASRSQTSGVSGGSWQNLDEQPQQEPTSTQKEEEPKQSTSTQQQTI